jgi:hypothetical protein
VDKFKHQLGFSYSPKSCDCKFGDSTLAKKLFELAKLDFTSCEVGISVEWYNERSDIVY